MYLEGCLWEGEPRRTRWLIQYMMEVRSLSMNMVFLGRTLKLTRKKKEIKFLLSFFFNPETLTKTY